MTRLDKPFFAYRSFNKELATVKRFYELGVRQFCVFPANTVNSVGQFYSEYPPNWLYLNEYEFEHVDRQLDDVLAVAPDARFLFMIDLNSPIWLVRLFSRQLCDSMNGLTDALTTPDWVNATTTYMRALVSHVEAAFPGKVEAYILACGQTDEWMDYSQGRELPWKLDAYQTWCREHGYDVPAEIPTLAKRFRCDGPLSLRCPEADAEAIRYWRFISETVANGIRHFAVEARKLIPDTTKLGCFFGYILELNGGRLVQSGHLGYESVFSLPELDFFISPGDYEDRKLGGASGCMSPNGTLHLKNKNYFYEIDHRTSTANLQITKHVSLDWMKLLWKNTREDIMGLRREYCNALMNGASLWWFDMWGKFFEAPEVQAEIAEYLKISQRLADVNRQPDAEIAMIVDPDSAYYVCDYKYSKADVPFNLYRRLLTSLHQLGAPVQVYSFNDIPHIRDWSKIKLAILPGLFKLTPEKAAILQSYVLNSGRTVLWTYGAALNDGEKSTPDGQLALTGIPQGVPALTTVARDGWKSIFAPDTEALPPEQLRKIAENAGVHFYTDMLCPVRCTGDLLMIHTLESGPRTIRLKTPARPEALLGNALENVTDTSFVYSFEGPETILVELK